MWKQIEKAWSYEMYTRNGKNPVHKRSHRQLKDRYKQIKSQKTQTKMKQTPTALSIQSTLAEIFKPRVSLLTPFKKQK
jgi:hypothetical protein